MRWLMRLFRRERLERELESELRFHLEQQTRDLAATGIATDEARRLALASFGGLEPVKEAARDARGTRWLEDLGRDVHYSFRTMRRAKGLTAAVIVSLALGIGANGAIFSVIQALILRALPIANPDEVFFLNRTGFDEPNLLFSHPMLIRFKREMRHVGFAAMSSTASLQITTGQNVELTAGQLVSGDWFGLLGVGATVGRVLAPSDDEKLGGGAVAVLSHGAWTRFFARDPSVIGRTLRINGQPMTLVGVAAEGFAGLMVGQTVDVWAPLSIQHELRYYGNASNTNGDLARPWVSQDEVQWLTVIARAPLATRAAVLARMDTVYRQDLEERSASIADPVAREQAMREHIGLLSGARGLSSLRDTMSPALLVLMGAVGLLLVVACANLANLLLARSASRASEFAVRLSLGAARGRLVRQLITESVMPAGLGGVLGLVVAYWSGRALLRLASSTSRPIPLDLPLDWTFAAFGLGLSILTGLLFGLVPALRLSRVNVSSDLRSARRVIGAERARRFPASSLLVAAQVGLSLTLLIGAGLFVRTFQNLVATDLGFDREQVLSARFNPRLAGIDPPSLPRLYERLLTQARAIAGTRAAALATWGPVTGSNRTGCCIQIDGRPNQLGTAAAVREDFITEEYFDVLGAPIIRGRAFGTQDGPDAAQVAIVNAAFARKFFGDADPIGHAIGYGDPSNTIIGVVPDAKVDGPRGPEPAMVYYSLRQYPQAYGNNVYVRMANANESAREALRRAVTAADPNLAVREVVSLAELNERLMSRERLVSRLTGVFGLLAVAVACLGLYGTVSYSVSRRTNEIGIRLALGASQPMVRWMILRETLFLVLLGLLTGVALALPTMSLVGSLLYGLSPRDPSTIAFSMGLLLAIGFLAGAIPAWRASRVEPTAALRAD